MVGLVEQNSGTFIFYILVTFCAGFSDAILFGTTNNSMKILSGLVGLIMFIPSISITVRRLHDVNKSGWYYLFFWLISILITIVVISSYAALTSTNENLANLIAIIGLLAFFALGFYSIYLMVLAGNKGDNKYGPDPLSELSINRISEPSFNVNFNSSEVADENLELLERLHALFKRGILSHDEFAARKREILGINAVEDKHTSAKKKQSPIPMVENPFDS